MTDIDKQLGETLLYADKLRQDYNNAKKTHSASEVALKAEWFDWFFKILNDYETAGHGVLAASILFTSFGQGTQRQYLSSDATRRVATKLINKFDLKHNRKGYREGKRMAKLVFAHKGQYGNFHYHLILLPDPGAKLDTVISQYTSAVSSVQDGPNRHFKEGIKRGDIQAGAKMRFNELTCIDTVASKAEYVWKTNEDATAYAAHDIMTLADSFVAELSVF